MVLSVLPSLAAPMLCTNALWESTVWIWECDEGKAPSIFGFSSNPRLSSFYLRRRSITSELMNLAGSQSIGHHFCRKWWWDITWISTSLIWLSLSLLTWSKKTPSINEASVKMLRHWDYNACILSISSGYEDVLYLERGAYLWSTLYSGWLWYCEDNIHVYAIEFEKTLSDIVRDDLVHRLPYVMTSCFALYGQGSRLCHYIRMWDPYFIVGRRHAIRVLADIGFCVRRWSIALQLHATLCVLVF